MFNFLLHHRELINVLAGLGTFVSSLLAFYTLLEVKKQRLSTYKPLVLIKSFIVSIDKSPLLIEPAEFSKFHVANFNEYKEDNQQTKNDFNLSALYKVENLGFGAALDVKLTWIFDMSKALGLLQAGLPLHYKMQYYKPLNYCFLNRTDKEDFQITLTDQDRYEHRIDYLAPINIKEHLHYHAIPQDIVMIHFLYFIFINNLTSKIRYNKSQKGLEEFPKTALKIEYSDLNGKQYVKKYNFKTSIVLTQIGDTIDMSTEFGYIHFEL